MATSTTGGSANDLRNTSGSFLDGYTAISVCIWHKSDSTGTDRGLIYTEDTTPDGGDRSQMLRHDAAGVGGSTNCYRVCIDTTTNLMTVETATNSQTTNLRHACLIWLQTEATEMWLDGVQDATYTPSGTSSGTVDNNTAILLHRGSKDTSDCWDGDIYDMRIYNRKLTENEMKAMFATNGSVSPVYGCTIHWHPNAGAPGTSCTSAVDRTGGGHPATSNGTVTYAEDLVHVRRRRAA